MDVHVDIRQVVPGCLRAALLRALAHTNAPEPQNQDRLPLEQFQSMRSSIVWEFNKLYWSRLRDWEIATGKGYEQALPGGASDGHNPEAIADSVEDFWTLLKDLESKNQLPPEIYLLEIGVGTGTRCGMWLTKFRTRGSGARNRLLSETARPAGRLFTGYARHVEARGGGSRRSVQLPGAGRHESAEEPVVPAPQDHAGALHQRLRQPAG
jgi:hypothetical protein